MSRTHKQHDKLQEIQALSVSFPFPKGPFSVRYEETKICEEINHPDDSLEASVSEKERQTENGQHLKIMLFTPWPQPLCVSALMHLHIWIKTISFIFVMLCDTNAEIFCF